MKKLTYLILALLVLNLPLVGKEKEKLSQSFLFEQIRLTKGMDKKQEKAEKIFDQFRETTISLLTFWDLMKEKPELKKHLEKSFNYYLDLYEIQSFTAPYKKSAVLKSLKKETFVDDLKEFFKFEISVFSMIKEGKI